MVNTRSTRYDEETTIMDGDRRIVKRQKDERKSDGKRTKSDERRTVRRQKGERKSDDKKTNDDDRRTNGDDKRTVRRQNDDDKRTMKRQRGDIRKFVSLKKLNEFSGRTDGVEQHIDRIEKEFQNNKEVIERKLEETKRQVQREILEKIEGLGHQLHRASITDLGDGSISPGTPLQNSSPMHAERSVQKLLKPHTYDGQSSWSMYRRQFEAAAKANGWTSQEMATSLVISLRGHLEILQGIPEERQNDDDRNVGALE
ncbi:hypothetical protein NQ318_022768 [Aromia moschata]|uniref:Uncharacterized protein n=1 Tax=Aromia moschata TaxID=1265417 RepID=A0AAV8YEC6_9CUCU|nr:hypothetical protein NQ318_022768 [Aromia moschata]